MKPKPVGAVVRKRGIQARRAYPGTRPSCIPVVMQGEQPAENEGTPVRVPPKPRKSRP